VPRAFVYHDGMQTGSGTEFDAIVIGTGQAGPPLARRLVAAGQKVAIVERKLFGGTCVNTGCIPTKTMVASAYAAHVARRGDEYGFHAGPVSVDMKRVKTRKDDVSGKSRTGLENSLKSLEGCTVFEGHARFESARTVRVGDRVIQAEKIFVNVGGRAAIPQIKGLDQIEYLTNGTMMSVDFVPRHLIVLGGGYIALEFGQMFRRFGSEVTILERGPRLLSREDEDVSAEMKRILEVEGITVRLNVKVEEFAKRGDDVIAKMPDEIAGSHVLIATGRTPNTDDLGLTKASVAVDAHGYITVDDQLRTSVPGIWALGDCNGCGAFTHTSYNDFEIVAANLLDHDARRVTDRIPCYSVYTDPPLGRAGMTEAEVRKSGKPALIGFRPMTKIARAVEKGETNGFVKILIEADSKLILGAAVFGTGGDEVVHSLLDMMYAKAPYTVITRAVHIHPTVSELIPTTLEDLKPLKQ
jgi:pyruvate/2-oxoglutarate dehydrogenase complex dihydrolipoamide dehydrogenase (E3) component